MVTAGGLVHCVAFECNPNSKFQQFSHCCSQDGVFLKFLALANFCGGESRYFEQLLLLSKVLILLAIFSIIPGKQIVF